MFRSLFTSATLFFTLLTSLGFAQCCEDWACCSSFQVGVGWRRDDIDWKIEHIKDYSFDAIASSHLHFKKFEAYEINGKARFVGEAYFMRFSANYGQTDKGRLRELFKVNDPFIGIAGEAYQKSRLKRRGEVFDFNGATGYPFTSCNCRMYIVPMIGYSFHRQTVRSEDHVDVCSFDLPSMEQPSCSCAGVDSFGNELDQFGNPIVCQGSSDQIYTHSEFPIAVQLGLPFPCHKSSYYRFTWYGPYLGVDVAYALDDRWTLYGEVEYHFFCNAHRIRETRTEIDFVDDYHRKARAHGLIATVGTVLDVGACYHIDMAVDYKWWSSKADRDKLHWDNIGFRIAMGYTY